MSPKNHLATVTIANNHRPLSGRAAGSPRGFVNSCIPLPVALHSIALPGDRLIAQGNDGEIIGGTVKVIDGERVLQLDAELESHTTRVHICRPRAPRPEQDAP